MDPYQEYSQDRLAPELEQEQDLQAQEECLEPEWQN